MYIFSLFALTWIPLYYIQKWYSEVKITTMIGYKEGGEDIFLIEDMEEEREKYNTIMVEYEKNGEMYKYVSYEKLMSWPVTRKNMFKTRWIKEAKLITGDVEMDMDITETVREYGGINEDFHGTPFDFRWILMEYPEYEFYDNCMLIITTKDNEKALISIEDNTEDTDILQKYNIKLIEIRRNN